MGLLLALTLERLLVAVLLRREGAARDLGRELARGGAERPGQVGVPLGELRRAGGKAGHVLPDENLGVAVGAGPDADRRDTQRGGDLRGERRRYALEHDREGAGGLQGLRVVQQPLTVLAAALHPEPAERVHRLR